jgi:hypothetical protein
VPQATTTQRTMATSQRLPLTCPTTTPGPSSNSRSPPFAGAGPTSIQGRQRRERSAPRLSQAIPAPLGLPDHFDVATGGGDLAKSGVLADEWYVEILGGGIDQPISWIAGEFGCIPCPSLGRCPGGQVS